MKFIADLHVHSRFSRATSAALGPENLFIAARRKGINIVATGDFTHPLWREELREKLIPAEPGLFKLKGDIGKTCEAQIPRSCAGMARFILSTEISSIYKKNGKTRKNHNLVFVPDFTAAGRLSERLAKIGNIAADGRPILGLDAKYLLEILLETSADAFMIPAHIWTPWFSLLGSQSGFDSIDECFEDLAPHIFAVETGLSSDPGMNRRVSGLDRLTLVSNSDAHSPGNLGREANIFDTDLSYGSLKSALASGDPSKFLGTIEFYPEEGKYHLDGHRKCKIRLHPGETRNSGGNCPVCGKPLTLGVLHRVEELADRSAGEPPVETYPFYHRIPLIEVLSEIHAAGVKSKQVEYSYRMLLEKLGPEFLILNELPVEELKSSGVPLLGEAIRRMRIGKVHISPGYDGEYGKISVFDPAEREFLNGQTSLFGMRPETRGADSDAETRRGEAGAETAGRPCAPAEKRKRETEARPLLNSDQRLAVAFGSEPLLIVAGPGTGKTHTLTHRIAHLLNEGSVPAEKILAVTFTRKAALEMRERLSALIPSGKPIPAVATFHAFCLDVLREEERGTFSILDDAERLELVREAILRTRRESGRRLSPERALKMLVSAKQRIMGPEENPFSDLQDKGAAEALDAIYATYQKLLSIHRACDFEDLLFRAVRLFETDEAVLRKYRELFPCLFIDELQDVNQGQYRLVRALSPDGRYLCAIGDPDQAIYGFRGSDVRYFSRFLTDYPDAGVIRLKENYRSSSIIVSAAQQLIRNHRMHADACEVFSKIVSAQNVRILDLPTEKAEAVAIGKKIEEMVGGLGFHSIDFGAAGNDEIAQRSFADFAVFYRTRAQALSFAEAFGKAGIPFQLASRESAFEKDGIRELVSTLKILEGGGSFLDLERVVKTFSPGFGRKGLGALRSFSFQRAIPVGEALERVRIFPVPGMSRKDQREACGLSGFFAAARKALNGAPPLKKVLFIAENSNIQGKLGADPAAGEIFRWICRTAEAFRGDAARFLAELQLETDADLHDPRAEKVSLMTLHAAKGLEFPVVFLAGCEEGFLPHEGSEEAPVDMGEERRLFYVGMTRAKELLFLTFARKRNVRGKSVPRRISPFLQEIGEALKQVDPVFRKTSAKGRNIQIELF